MHDYAGLLYQWRKNNVPNADCITVEEYHSDAIGKDVLVITAGDSWTYGESLGPTRLFDVYGRKVSQALDADWINIGLPGRSNSYILNNIAWLLDQLKHNFYKKIFVFITLTENGREPGEVFASSIDYSSLGTENFYNNLLNAIEQEWIKNLNTLATTMPANCKLIVGQNFVWHQNVVSNLVSSITVPLSNWIEKLGEYQQMTLPPRATLVTGWIFDSIRCIHSIIPETDPALYKIWALPYIDLANQVNAWLAQSDLNNQGASKHPVAQGHQIWADYLLSHINVD